MKKKTNIRKTEVPILNDEYFVYVFIGNREELLSACTQHIKKLIDDKDTISEYQASLHKFVDGRGFCMYFRNPLLNPMIGVNTEVCKNTGTPYEATLAHEAVHAVEDICQMIGQPFADEFAAHSVGAIVKHGIRCVK